MSEVTTAFIYGTSMAQVILLGIAFFYTFRIYRAVGSFRAWTLIMAGFVLLVINDLFTFLALITLPAASFDALLSTTSGLRALSPNIFSLGSSIALSAGVYGLSKLFKPKPTVATGAPQNS